VRRAGFAQLSAVALALAIVLGAGGYGITRGFLSDGTSAINVSSFHYVQTSTVTEEGKVRNSRVEGYYHSPMSVRAISDSEDPFLEMVLIGSRAWTRDAKGSAEKDPDSIRALAMAIPQTILLVANKRQDMQDVGDGPTVAGESTRRYQTMTDQKMTDTLGKAITSIENEASSSPECAELLASILGLQKRYNDVETTLELVVGEATNRTYSMVTTESGSNLTTHTELVIDRYDQPVDIRPPSDARPAPEKEPGRCSP
jgi:hypothetical protein